MIKKQFKKYVYLYYKNNVRFKNILFFWADVQRRYHLLFFPNLSVFVQPQSQGLFCRTVLFFLLNQPNEPEEKEILLYTN